MIGKINLNSSNVHYLPAFKADESVKEKVKEAGVSAPVTKPEELKGTEAVANYNKVKMGVKKDFNLEPLNPIEVDIANLDKIEGERIMTSDGKLYSIIQNKDDKKIMYKFGQDDSNKLSEVIVTDNETGKEIIRQEYSVDDGDEFNEPADIVRVVQDDGNGKSKSSAYVNGKLEYTSINYVNKYTGDDISINKYEKDGETCVFATNPRTGYRKDVTYDKNMQVKRSYQEFSVGNRIISKRGEFYKGALISMDKEERMAFPNSMGRDEINIPELKGYPKFEIDRDYKGMQGEKTYYSNGAIETNAFETEKGLTKASFNPNGDLEKVEFGNIDVNLNGVNQTITESLEGDAKRTTEYYNDKLSMVRYEADGRQKELFFNDGKVESYYDSPIDKNSDEPRHSLYFNRLGMLEDAYN